LNLIIHPTLKLNLIIHPFLKRSVVQRAPHNWAAIRCWEWQHMFN
jgi:hypothetical protein